MAVATRPGSQPGACPIRRSWYGCHTRAMSPRRSALPPSEGERRGATVGSADADLVAELTAERSASDHWRRVARQRTEALDALKHRRLVRVALAADRRTGGLRAGARAVASGLHRAASRSALVLSALPARAELPARRAGLLAGVAGLPAIAPGGRCTTVVVVAGEVVTALPPHVVGTAQEIILVTTSEQADVDGVDRIVRAPQAGSLAAAAARAIGEARGELVCLLSASSEPLGSDWLDRLTAMIDDTVVAAVPLLVHPRRSPTAATADDLLVRAAGVELQIDAAGAPQARHRQAGQVPSPGDTPAAVVAGSAACLLVDRNAYRAVGGLHSIGDLDAAVIDLCVRLGQAGNDVLCVAGSVVVDHRPVGSRAELDRPLDPNGVGWRQVVDHLGPALVHRARSPDDDRSGKAFARSDARRLRFALTVACPSVKVAHLWGDWHLSHALGQSLGRLGHEVRLQTAGEADSLAGRSCDVHVVVRGLLPVRRSTGQRHVLWIISHPEAIETSECDDADLVLVASERFAEALRRRTATPVDVLLQATDVTRFRPRRPDPDHQHPVTVVAKARDVLRPMVADALAAGLRPAIYGSGWRNLVDPALVVAEHIPNGLVPVVYSSAGVVLNDHWDTMRAWGFVSNRVFDVLACGAPLISDPMPQLQDLFGDAVATAGSPTELAAEVGAALADPVGARARAASGRRRVLDAHTFDHRARALIDLLVRHQLVSSPERR